MEYDGNHVYQKQTILKIDAAAIAHNVSAVRKAAGQATVIAVVKENGYGMGLEREYRLLSQLNINFYAVTNANEALKLREFGCQDNILLMSPCTDPDEALALHESDIIFMVGSMEQARILKQISESTGKKPRVHLAIETGMGRYGFRWNAIPDLSTFPEYFSVEGCYTHLNGKPKNYAKEARTQTARFQTALYELKKQNVPTGMRHISNSAATMSLGNLGMDAVRTGSALIGKCARGGSTLRNALWLEAPICQVMELPKNSTIGYQACAVLKRDSRLGLIRAGHGDGLFLSYADSPEPLLHGILHLIAVKLFGRRYQKTVSIEGRRVPLVGRSGIAHIVIDLTDTNIKEGDMARLDVNPLFVHPSVPKEIIKELP